MVYSARLVHIPGLRLCLVGWFVPPRYVMVHAFAVHVVGRFQLTFVGFASRFDSFTVAVRAVTFAALCRTFALPVVALRSLRCSLHTTTFRCVSRCCVWLPFLDVAVIQLVLRLWFVLRLCRSLFVTLLFVL